MKHSRNFLLKAFSLCFLLLPAVYVSAESLAVPAPEDESACLECFWDIADNFNQYIHCRNANARLSLSTCLKICGKARNVTAIDAIGNQAEACLEFLGGPTED